MRKLFLTIPLFFSLVACQQAARNVVYSAYEKIGIEKRDILKKRVKTAKEDQQEAGEKFTDALTQLKAMYGFEGGDLEKKYNELHSAYEKANDKASDVHNSIEKMETVAGDLFKEWEKEIESMTTDSLQSKSRRSLQDTRSKFAELDASLKKSEKRMKPVLQKLNDQVLYLKHNLNARAIGSLKGEATNIQGEIEKLVNEMNSSIKQADQFIDHMD